MSTSLEAMGVALPVEAVAEGAAAHVASLCQCADCGLQYFDPTIVGSSRLYEHLAEGHYYEPLRWDQRRVLGAIGPGMRVVDLGCGTGSFLDQVADIGAHATGVDFSQSATVAGNERIHFILGRADLAGDDFTQIRDQVSPAHFVTAFQLVEHLADPLTFVRHAAKLLGDRGVLAISLPNRHRFAIDPVQALDCPPHHQTRWTAEQLHELGRRAGLVVDRIEMERVRNPLRVAHRLIRRVLTRTPESWTLPPGARPWPPSHWFNGMSLIAFYSRRA